MNELSVTVIVPTFNRANYLSECLDSLLAQTLPALEIVVVDDGSEDPTPEIVAGYGERIRYLRKENGGKPSAVNMGFAASRGALIWLFDDDDVALPDAIEKRVIALQAAPDADFVYSPHYVGSDGPDGKILRGQLYIPKRADPDAFFLETMKCCFFHLNSALVKKECYAALGGIDTSLRTGEDYDFQIRLAQVARPTFCTTPSFIFRQHEGIRGPKTARYGASARAREFRESSAAIGRKLRRNVKLGEFLVPKAGNDLDASSRRAALLNRILVMANHGCIDELFDDLRAMLRTGESRPSLTAGETGELRTVVRYGWAYETIAENWTHFAELVRSLKGLPGGNDAIRALSAGLFLLARRAPGTFLERADKAWRGTQIAFESYR